MKTLILAAALVAAFPAGAQHFEARDLDPNTPGYEGAFDGARTWYTSPNASGHVSWAGGQSFVDGLTINGFSGWRTASIAELHTLYNSWSADMWLKNPDGRARNQSNIGAGFFNYESINFWLSPAAFAYWDGWPGNQWGTIDTRPEVSFAYAWAVHDGDFLAPVPEPETWLALLAGLGLLGARRRRS